MYRCAGTGTHLYEYEGTRRNFSTQNIWIYFELSLILSIIGVRGIPCKNALAMAEGAQLPCAACRMLSVNGVPTLTHTSQMWKPSTANRGPRCMPKENFISQFSVLTSKVKSYIPYSNNGFDLQRPRHWLSRPPRNSIDALPTVPRSLQTVWHRHSRIANHKCSRIS